MTYANKFLRHQCSLIGVSIETEWRTEKVPELSH